MKCFVRMRSECVWREAARLDIDAQFLVELADQRRLGRLPGLHLAAGKLPGAGEMLPGRTLGQEDAAVGVDQRDCGDEGDRLTGSGHRSVIARRRSRRGNLAPGSELRPRLLRRAPNDASLLASVGA